VPASQNTSTPWRIVHSEASLGWGGQEHRVLAELRGFQRRGSQVWLVAPPQSQIFQRAEQAGVPVVAQRFNQRAFLPLHIVKQALWLRRNRVQIVNPHSSRDAWLMTIAARIARVPLIIRSRHFDVPIPNKSVSRLMYREWSHFIITTSPVITQAMKEAFAMSDDEIRTISTGVDLDRFSPQGPRAELPVPTDVLLVGMITVIRWAKGAQILAEALKLLRDEGLRLHAVIVGEGPARNWLQEQIATLGVADQITFTGHREDVPDIMRRLDIVAIPSFHEAIPQSGLQALATGVPVVASDVGGIPSIIQNGITGRLAISQDARSLADGLRAVLTEKEKTQAMCATGRAFIEKEHSLEAMLDRLEAVYRAHLGV
jgi:glycosyltransferase involved in cell wall biosynthesis